MKKINETVSLKVTIKSVQQTDLDVSIPNIDLENYLHEITKQGSAEVATSLRRLAGPNVETSAFSKDIVPTIEDMLIPTICIYCNNVLVWDSYKGFSPYYEEMLADNIKEHIKEFKDNLDIKLL